MFAEQVKFWKALCGGKNKYDYRTICRERDRVRSSGETIHGNVFIFAIVGFLSFSWRARTTLVFPKFGLLTSGSFWKPAWRLSKLAWRLSKPVWRLWALHHLKQPECYENVFRTAWVLIDNDVRKSNTHRCSKHGVYSTLTNVTCIVLYVDISYAL